MNTRRLTKYHSTAPLAQGRTRNQLVRFFVSSSPNTFQRLRRLAERTGQPLTVTADFLIRHALNSLGDPSGDTEE